MSLLSMNFYKSKTLFPAKRGLLALKMEINVFLALWLPKQGNSQHHYFCVMCRKARKGL